MHVIPISRALTPSNNTLSIKISSSEVANFSYGHQFESIIQDCYPNNVCESVILDILFHPMCTPSYKLLINKEPPAVIAKQMVEELMISPPSLAEIFQRRLESTIDDIYRHNKLK